MEQKIDLEIRLHELAAQSMLEARNEIEALEVEKSLLASEQRMNCYAAQLEERRKLLSSATMSTTSGDSGRGSRLNVGSDRSRDMRRPNKSTAGDKTTSPKQPTTDVIGDSHPSAANESLLSPLSDHPTKMAASSSSPSQFSSLSAQTPSKLSPVFDQSANSPTSSAQSAGNSANDNSSNSSNSIVNRSHRSNGNLDKSSAEYRRTKSAANSSNGSSGTNDSNDGRQLRRTTNVRRSKQTKRTDQVCSKSSLQGALSSKLGSGVSRATVSISELRIPLMWRDVDHFKNRGDYKRYALFCLLKIDSQIYDTQLISDVDRHVTDVDFDDVITFIGVDQTFELTVEVYSCLYLEQFSFSSTPRKLKEKLSNSVSRAMGRRLATQTASANYIKELQAYDR